MSHRSPRNLEIKEEVKVETPDHHFQPVVTVKSQVSVIRIVAFGEIAIGIIALLGQVRRSLVNRIVRTTLLCLTTFFLIFRLWQLHRLMTLLPVPWRGYGLPGSFLCQPLFVSFGPPAVLSMGKDLGIQLVFLSVLAWHVYIIHIIKSFVSNPSLQAVLVLQIISATMGVPLFTASCVLFGVYPFKWSLDADGITINIINIYQSDKVNSVSLWNSTILGEGVLSYTLQLLCLWPI